MRLDTRLTFSLSESDLSALHHVFVAHSPAFVYALCHIHSGAVILCVPTNPHSKYESNESFYLQGHVGRCTVMLEGHGAGEVAAAYVVYMGSAVKHRSKGSDITDV